MTIDEMIAVLTAAKEGKAIELRVPGGMWDYFKAFVEFSSVRIPSQTRTTTLVAY